MGEGGLEKGLWALALPLTLPFPVGSGLAKFLASPHFISRKSHQAWGMRGPRPMPLDTPPLTVEVFKVPLLA